MRTLTGVVVLSLSLSAGAGCRSSPLKDHFDSVSKEIASAKSAGAPKYAPQDYEGAEQALDLAKDGEARAIAQRERAEEDREQAKKDLTELKKLEADREAALDEACKRQVGAAAYLRSLHAREAQLRAKGVTEKEIDKAHGEQIALTTLEESAAKAQIKNVRTELELLAVREQEAAARITSANDGIDVAGQQLLHAKALCDTAGAEARMAEAHAIAKRRAELEVR